MAKSKKITLNERALAARINRKTSTDGIVVRKSRGERMRQEVGRWYRLDVGRGLVVEHDVSLEALGRELGVLAAWEQVTS